MTAPSAERGGAASTIDDLSSAPLSLEGSARQTWNRRGGWFSPRWWGLLLTWGILLSGSFYRAPIPGVNEPHYLTKAKHFWNPDFCPGDFFLDSSNPHLVFYVAIGWLTTFCSLTTTAIVGRIVGLGLLAWGWNRAIEGGITSLPGRLLATLLFLWFAAMGNLSGEWVVGGIESKIISYGLILWGVALWREGRTNRAAALAGIAVSFHPLAAGWWLIAVAAGWVMQRSLAWFRTRLIPARDRQRETFPRMSDSEPESATGASTSAATGKSLLEWGRILGIGLLAALPGIIPALVVIGGDPEVGLESSRLQLKWRLGHHTDPRLFPVSMYRYYGLLLACWVYTCCYGCVWRRCPAELRSPRQPHSTEKPSSPCGLFWFTLGSLLIASAGAVIGWGDLIVSPEVADRLRLTFLKFYFFRLADIVLPASLAIMLAWSIERFFFHRPNPSELSEIATAIGSKESWTRAPLVFLLSKGSWISQIVQLLLVVIVGVGVVHAMKPEVVDGLMRSSADDLSPEEYVAQKALKRQQWLKVCEWLRTTTPIDSVVASANMDTEWAIKWFAERPEYVSFKDCPQEPSGIVEWWRRRQSLVMWSKAAKSDGNISLADLHDLHEQTGIDYLLVTKYGPLPGPPAYRIGPFQVYAVPERAAVE